MGPGFWVWLLGSGQQLLQKVFGAFERVAVRSIAWGDFGIFGIVRILPWNRRRRLLDFAVWFDGLQVEGQISRVAPFIFVEAEIIHCVEIVERHTQAERGFSGR
jgi:hypothetical protein